MPDYRNLWMEKPGRLLSIGSRRVGHDSAYMWLSTHAYIHAYIHTHMHTYMHTCDLAYKHALEKEMVIHSSILAWRIPGTGEPGGLLSMGLHRVGHDWNNLAAAAWVIKDWTFCLASNWWSVFEISVIIYKSFSSMN